ncbi:MAG TPA: tetratricopeptide repeat protein [Thermoanaerobaculia bacterium]|nr:tetratricopeptide repeat protein [Thermoanaerobaculia bacterium]
MKRNSAGKSRARPRRRPAGRDERSSGATGMGARSEAEPNAAPATPPAAALAASRILGWRWALAVALIACAVRAVVAHQLGQTALYRWPQLDALEFLERARRIAHGDLAIPPFPTKAPIYPLVLGALLRLTGESLAAVRLIQAAFGAAACALTAGAAARLLGRGAGIACGLLLAVYGPLVLVDTQLWEEVVLLPLLALVLWSLTLERPSLWAAGAMGAALGLASVTRPTALALLPLVLVRLWRSAPRRGLALAIASSLVVATVGAAVLTASRASGGFVFVRGYAAIATWIGNDPAGGGVQNARLGGSWDRLEAEPYRQGARQPREIERYFMRKLLQRTAADPLGFARTLGSKLLWLFQAEEVRDNHSFEFFRAQSAALRWLPGFGLLLPLALCGAWSAWREGRLPWVMVAYIALLSATAVLLIYGMRYRLPIVPGVAILGGGGVVALWRVLRGAVSMRRWQQAAVPLALLLAGATAAQARRYPPDRNFAEEWALTGSSYEEAGRPDEAEQAFARAREADPRSALGWDGLGRVRLVERRWDEAAAAFRRAIALDPDYRRSHYHLALVDERQGRPAEAEQELLAALAISPLYPLCLQELGALRLSRGDLAGAEQAYRGVLELEPRAPGPLLGLARLAGARGRPSEGIAYARRAVALQPDDAEGWLFLGALALGSGDAGPASDAVAALRRLRGDSAAEVLLLAAGVDHLRGDYAAADEKLRRLLRSNPSPQAAELFLRNAAAMGQRPAAEAWLASLHRS